MEKTRVNRSSILHVTYMVWEILHNQSNCQINSNDHLLINIFRYVASCTNFASRARWFERVEFTSTTYSNNWTPVQGPPSIWPLGSFPCSRRFLLLYGFEEVHAIYFPPRFFTFVEIDWSKFNIRNLTNRKIQTNITLYFINSIHLII